MRAMSDRRNISSVMPTYTPRLPKLIVAAESPVTASVYAAPSATVGRFASPSTITRSMSCVLPSCGTTSTMRSYQRKVARLS